MYFKKYLKHIVKRDSHAHLNKTYKTSFIIVLYQFIQIVYKNTRYLWNITRVLVVQTTLNGSIYKYGHTALNLAGIIQWIGVRGAVLVLPLISLVGYGLVAFIPVFSEYLTRHGRDEAFKLARSAMRMLSVILAATAVVGILAAPLIVQVVFWI